MYYTSRNKYCPICNEVLKENRLCSCFTFTSPSEAVIYYTMHNKKPELHHSHINDEKEMIKFFRKYNIDLIKKLAWKEFIDDSYESFFYRESVRSISKRILSVFLYELKKVSSGIVSLLRLFNIGYSEVRRFFIIKNYRAYWSDKDFYFPAAYRYSEEYNYFINRKNGNFNYDEPKPISKITFVQTFLALIAEILYLAFIFLIVFALYKIFVV